MIIPSALEQFLNLTVAFSTSKNIAASRSMFQMAIKPRINSGITTSV